MKKHHRLKWTNDSREYNILIKTKSLYENSCERLGLCDCPRHRAHWSLSLSKKVWGKYQRNWKKFRKTQYKMVDKISEVAEYVDAMQQ